MALVQQSDGTYLDDETGIVYDYSSGSSVIVAGMGASSSGIPSSSGDTIQQAAIRALGINPVPNADGTYSWTDPNANYAKGDPTAIAQQAATQAQQYYDQQLANNTAAVAAANKKCGGFLADLLNPFSANVDPNQWNCKAANALAGVNWTALIALAVVLAILATVHQVKEIV